MIIACPESTKRLAQRERDRCEGYRVDRTAQSLSGGLSHHQWFPGGLMGLWMLSFGDRGAAIVEAESMIHARLRVAVKGLIGASFFVGGCQIAGARTSQLKGSGRPRRPKPQSAMWPRQQILP